MQGFVSFTLNCLKAHTLSHRITKDTNEFSGYVTLGGLQLLFSNYEKQTQHSKLHILRKML